MIKLTTNKNLYNGLSKQDTFSDRLILFLLHFAFFLKVYKNDDNTKILQEIYDFINLFHTIISEIHFWDDYTDIEKKNKITLFLENIEKNDYLVEYFDDFKKDLTKKNLNYFLKSVSNP